MARGPTYGSRATHPPHWGSTRTEPDLQRHPYTNEAKERVKFWSVQRCPFITYISSTDLNSDFLQIPLEESSRMWTAFHFEGQTSIYEGSIWVS